jgi:pectin methylesterase-like acyl-CoA thioesterase
MKIKLSVFIVLFPIAVNAGSFYVSPTGDDSNSGTSSNPFKSIQYAIDIASNGDYIKLKSGIYNESIRIDKNR